MASTTAGTRVNALVLSFTLVSGVVVFFRLFTRTALLRNAGLEDVCITLAMTSLMFAFSVGLTVTISIQVRNGMGKHFNELSTTEVLTSGQAFWASVWLYNLSLTFTKISILIQYLRIFVNRRFFIVCMVALGIVTIYGTWTFFGSIFLCTPVPFFWDKSITGGKCLNQFAVWFTNGGVNIAQDFAILVLPMPLLRNLQIPKGQKRALVAIFALGGVVCIISIIRLQSLVAISNSSDPTFDNAPAASWSAIETNVAIITACLPSLRPLLSALLPRYFPSTPTQLTDLRPYDEERPKHLKKLSISTLTRPTTATTRTYPHSRSGSNMTNPLVSPLTPQGYSHSRTGSNTAPPLVSPLSDTAPETIQAVLAGTGARINGPVRQVHIRSSSRESSLSRAGTPRPRPPPMPMPENIATFTIVRDERQSRYSLNFSSPPNPPPSRGRPFTPRTPRTPVAQKPLPITPFPVSGF